MLSLKKTVYSIERPGMKIALPTLTTNFCFNILNHI